MKFINLISFVLAATVTVTCLSACQFRSDKSSEMIPISYEERAVIEAGQTEGKDELEIAGDLISYEDQLAGDQDNASGNDPDNAPGGDKASADGQTAGQDQGNSSDPNTTGDNGAASSGNAASGNTASGGSASGNTASGSSASAGNTSSGNTASGGDSASGGAASGNTGNGNNVTGGAKATPTSKPSGSSGGTTIPGGHTIPTPKPTTKPVSGKATTTPTAKPTAKPTTKPADTQSDYEFMDAVEKECVRLINELRKEEACTNKSTFYVPVVIDSSLQERAHVRCLETTDDFSHNSASGKKMPGEAIYRGTATSTDPSTAARSIVNAWKNSKGHYPLLITGCIVGTGDYASMNCGMGVVKRNGYYYAVFGCSGGNKGSSPSSGYTGPTNTPTPTATPAPVRVTYRVAEGNGSVTKTENADGTVTLTAVPDEGWNFSGWYDYRWYSFSKDPTVTITRDNDGTAIQVVFTEKPKPAAPTTAPDTPAPTTPPAETAPTEKPPVETDPSEIEI